MVISTELVKEFMETSIDWKKEISFKAQLKTMVSTKEGLKSLVLPRSKSKHLLRLNFEMNKYKSKRSIFRKFISPLTIIGASLVLLVLTWAVFAPWLSRYTFDELISVDTTRPALQPPDADHPLGTGQFGRDVLGRLIFGARSSLSLGFFAVVISVVLGVIVGLIAAYQGGLVDAILMRLGDVVMAFPGLIITLLLIAVLGQDVKYILLSWGFLGIPGYARLMRGSVLQEKGKVYVEAAKVSGASNVRIMFKHILRNAIAPIIISVTFDIGGIILGLAGLGFLGYGAQGIEWGNEIAENKAKLVNAPWCAIWPGVGILITVLGFMLLGDGLRDALDPRSKA